MADRATRKRAATTGAKAPPAKKSVKKGAGPAKKAKAPLSRAAAKPDGAVKARKAPAKAAGRAKERAPPPDVVAPTPASPALEVSSPQGPEVAPKPRKAAKAARAPVEKTRIVFPKDLYESRKDEIKAPLKEHGLKWQYLGEGRGRYHKEGVNLFAQFLDDGVHYSLWGDDKATVERLASAWRGMLGEEAWAKATASGEAAVKKEEEVKESEAIKLWKLGEPVKRPGEPDFFFKKRVAEWEARKPTS